MNSAPYVVLSNAYWYSYFHADPGVVGKTVQINKHPLTIIGIAPPSFRGTELFFAPALWIPMIERPLVQGYDGLKIRGNRSSFVLGRLKPGVSPQEAAGDLNALGAWLSKTYPTDDDGVKFTLARPGLVGDMLGGPARAFMAGLMLLAGLILLAACANLGSLFRRPRRGSCQRGGSAAGAGVAPRAHFAAVAHRGGAYFDCRRSDRAGRRHRILHGLSAWQPIRIFPLMFR